MLTEKYYENLFWEFYLVLVAKKYFFNHYVFKFEESDNGQTINLKNLFYRGGMAKGRMTVGITINILIILFYTCLIVLLKDKTHSMSIHLFSFVRSLFW